ncbi:MAG TPA: hypothetical protein VE444_00445, partial [Gaiellaceae bacterium]|nr:hypothetical protein [Gaiellaceae bacterium]
MEQRGRHAKRTLDRSAGDLNTASQKLLLSYQAETEFAVDVAKACHHGAEDVDISFVRAMSARATVISSGDNEDYSNPRPVLMGASARYDRESRSDRDDVQPRCGRWVGR